VAAGLGIVTAIVIGVLIVLRIAEPDPFAHLRQSTRQQIPGALGFELEPPPEDVRPELTPREVRGRYPTGGGDAQISFASVRDTLGGRSIGPAWVLFARGVASATRRVSSSRTLGGTIRTTSTARMPRSGSSRSIR
jgi:hypothetical protein